MKNIKINEIYNLDIKTINEIYKVCKIAIIIKDGKIKGFIKE